MLVPLIDANRLLDLRFSLKKPLAAVPGVGWSLQFLMHIFLNRNFDNDKDHIAKCFDYYRDYFNNILFVLYPEGTVFWPDTKAKSDKFAEDKGRTKFNNVLLPRTTGFNFILEQCKRTGIDTIYDITALYESRIPQDERAFFLGGMPSETHYIIKKVNVSDVTEEYLFDAWDTKDDELELFYNEGKITQKKVSNPVSSQAWLLQNIGIFFWPWFVVHNFHYFFSYWLFLTPSFLVMFTLMKLNDGDLAKFCIARM
jgi:1-acyl-sn-glycerol-3-phosphate acyltransferase